ncbi:MAG: ADP-ribosylglycohydrolase family protein [Nanoarchaeota archaeon]|nr:ADP-ribosylglycohydrolase family protein [Nanoarchaeota archaeon]MBU4456142.1 ADP-ribosylglycohydrolase family protein [Nanoarchaeota archaeon]MCG2719617.1 ADP-ribosylglycohydrolase family protein [Nanoarchaeota archaeon]
MKLNKYQNMLLGIAIGDAFGASYEMQPWPKISKQLHLSSYHGLNNRKQGTYTDDTQMSIAVAELLISDKEFTKENLAEKFVECYKRDPHQGYAKGFQNFLESVSSGEEFLEKINSNSIRNGAAMRSVPLGVLSNLEDIIKYAKINASITHNTPKGITSSVCVATVSHYVFHKLGEYKDIFDFCIDSCQGLDNESISFFERLKNRGCLEPLLLFGENHADFGVPCDGMRTAGAVLYLVSKSKGNLEKSLTKSILLGGDTDSTASIVCGIIAINEGLNSLPSFLFDKLENDKYGRDYLISLGQQLSAK